MNQTGSGGLGAISAGISEPIAWIVIAVLVIAVALGVWKLVKFLSAITG